MLELVFKDILKLKNVHNMFYIYHNGIIFSIYFLLNILKFKFFKHINFCTCFLFKITLLTMETSCITNVNITLI